MVIKSKTMDNPPIVTFHLEWAVISKITVPQTFTPTVPLNHMQNLRVLSLNSKDSTFFMNKSALKLYMVQMGTLRGYLSLFEKFAHPNYLPPLDSKKLMCVIKMTAIKNSS